MKHIIVMEKTHSKGLIFKGYENFKELKDKVIDRLDGCNWVDKKRVKLNSIESCLTYIHSDCQSFMYKITQSYKQYSECNNDTLGSKGYCYKFF